MMSDTWTVFTPAQLILDRNLTNQLRGNDKSLILFEQKNMGIKHFGTTLVFVEKITEEN